MHVSRGQVAAPLPSCPCYFAEYDAVIRVPDGELIEADDAFPKSKLRLVQVWVDLHAAELLARLSKKKEETPKSPGFPLFFK